MLSEIFLDSKSQTTASGKLSIEFIISARRGFLHQLRIVLGGAFTGDVTVTLDKNGTTLDQIINTTTFTAETNKIIKDIDIMVQNGDVIKLSTSVNVPNATHSVELGYFTNGT